MIEGINMVVSYWFFYFIFIFLKKIVITLLCAMWWGPLEEQHFYVLFFPSLLILLISIFFTKHNLAEFRYIPKNEPNEIFHQFQRNSDSIPIPGISPYENIPEPNATLEFPWERFLTKAQYNVTRVNNIIALL